MDTIKVNKFMIKQEDATAKLLELKTTLPTFDGFSLSNAMRKSYFPTLHQFSKQNNHGPASGDVHCLLNCLKGEYIFFSEFLKLMLITVY